MKMMVDFSNDIIGWLVSQHQQAFPEAESVLVALTDRVQGVRHPLDEGGEVALEYLSGLDEDHNNYLAILEAVPEQEDKNV